MHNEICSRVWWYYWLYYRHEVSLYKNNQNPNNVHLAAASLSGIENHGIVSKTDFAKCRRDFWRFSDDFCHYCTDFRLLTITHPLCYYQKIDNFKLGQCSWSDLRIQHKHKTLCLMRGTCLYGYIHVLGILSPQNTVGRDTFENIEFPSFLITCYFEVKIDHIFIYFPHS